jgi:hypothetical protein
MSLALTSVERINALKNGIEATTGETYVDLTEGVQALKNGYGQGGGDGTEEIENIIDASGVLGTTDETVTVTDKVEQLIDYANFKNIIQESLNLNGVNGNMGYISVFRNTGIKDVSMFDFSKIAWMSNAFQNTQIEELEIDITNAIYIDNMCDGCKNLKRVVLKNMGSAVKSVRNAFFNNSLLESVGTLNFEGTTNTGNIFFGCDSLRDVSFVPETTKISIEISSPVLTKESISGKEGIINGLNSEVTGQTLTLKRDAVKKAFETSEGANDGDESAEWLALKDTKQNWTITLS